METFAHLAGAVALLLWGIRTVRTGVERLLGPRIEAHVAMLTGRRTGAFGVGAAVAFALQSSTAVRLMAASFYAGGVLALPAGLAAALGAEVGSSLAAAVLNVDVALLAPVLLVAGYITFSVARERRGKHVGRIILGLAFILTSLSLMSTATAILGANEDAADIIRIASTYPAALVLVAALATWLMHSSIAAILMIAHLAGGGGLPPEAALWMVVGVNAGSALPALVSGWTLAGPARELLVAAFAMRIAAVAVCALVLAAPGIGDLAAVQFAAGHVILAHLALNVAMAVALLPFVGIIAALVRRAAPKRAPEGGRAASHIFLAPEDVRHPGTALINIANEAARVAHIVYDMVGGISELFWHGDADARIKSLEDDVDRLYREVTLYMASIRLDELDDDERRQWFELFEFVTHLEHVGDIITRNIIDLAKRKRKAGLDFSPAGAREIEGLTAELSDIFRYAQAVFLSRDPHRAEELVAAKRRFRSHTLDSQRRHALRLSSGVTSSIASSRIHLDLLRELQRINSHLTAVAYPLLPEAS
ncbi:Na/Pi cotransporter family protein [Acuticoccus sediminis]|uniref:Na/Pi cotransporter family protein n=1 Tax=Acuticoccus sediminis TaxID=2184697 RepID=UPI001CFF0F29|nr:Na/Pi cotransporter family protein [Acuticoccus sediminis]